MCLSLPPGWPGWLCGISGLRFRLPGAGAEAGREGRAEIREGDGIRRKNVSERMLADGAGRSPEWTPNAFLLDLCWIPGKWAALRGDPPPPEGDFRLREAGPVCAPRRLFSGHLAHLILTRTLEVGAVIVLAFRVRRLSWPNKQLLQSHPERMQLTPDLTPSPDVTAGARTNVRGSLDHVLREHGDGSDLSPQDSPATGGRSKRHVRERDPEDPGQPFAVWLPRNRSTSLSIPFFI